MEGAHYIPCRIEFHRSHHRIRIVKAIAICMYVCRDIYVRAAAYNLDCHEGAMIYRRLYKTFQSLVERRTESVTTMNHELSVAVSSI